MKVLLSISLYVVATPAAAAAAAAAAVATASLGMMLWFLASDTFGCVGYDSKIYVFKS